MHGQGRPWKVKQIVAGVLAAVLAVAPLSAYAQLPAAASMQSKRMVRLRDGSMFRGEMVEQITTGYIILKLATGELRRIKWSDVIELTPLQPDSVTLQVAFQRSQAASPILIHVDDPRARLYRLVSYGGTCFTRHGSLYECTLASWNDTGLPLSSGSAQLSYWTDDDYMISGPGLRSSGRFLLTGGTVVDVKTARWSGPAGGGLALTILGLATLGSGAAALGIGVEQNSQPPPFFPGYPSPGQPLVIAGGVLIGLGAAATIAGSVLLAKYRTRVTISGQEVALKIPGTRLALSPAGLRF